MPSKSREPFYNTKCPPVFSARMINCTGENCAIWDAEHKQCFLRLFLAGYIKHQLLDLKLMSLYNDIKDDFDKHNKEMWSE